MFKKDIRGIAYFNENSPEKREGIYYIPPSFALITQNGYVNTLRASIENRKRVGNFEVKLLMSDMEELPKKFSLNNVCKTLCFQSESTSLEIRG